MRKINGYNTIAFVGFLRSDPARLAGSFATPIVALLLPRSGSGGSDSEFTVDFAAASNPTPLALLPLSPLF